MEQRVDVIFLKHLSTATVKIDMDDMLAWIQNAHGMVTTLEFERNATKNEKIQLLVKSLRGQRNPDLYPIFDYLVYRERQLMADAISKEMIDAMICHEDRKRKDVAVQTKKCFGAPVEVETEQVLTATAGYQTADRNEATDDQGSRNKPPSAAAAVEIVEVTTNISNGGATMQEDIIQKMKEKRSQRILRIGGALHGSVIEIFHPANPSIIHIVKDDVPDMIPVYCHSSYQMDKDHALVIGGRCARDYSSQHKGETVLAQTTIVDLVTFAVSPGPTLPSPTEHLAAASLHGTLYICGGSTSTKSAAIVACYELAHRNQKWIPISSLNTARYNHTLTALNGRLYAIGGLNSRREDLTSVECYDPAEDKWVEQPGRMNRARPWAASCAHRGKIWFTGGGGDGDETRRSTEVFDPVAETAWSDGPRLIRRRGAHGMLELDGRIYVIGGTNSSETIEVLNDETNQWEMSNLAGLEKCFWHAYSSRPQLLVSSSAAKRVVACPDPMLQRQERV